MSLLWCFESSEEAYKLVTDANIDNIKGSGTIVLAPTFSAERGDKIKVPIVLGGNPGIVGMVFTVNYDEKHFTLDKVEDGEVFKDTLSFTVSKSLKPGARFVWYGTHVEDADIRDGTVIYMYFSVSENAKSGRYPLNLTLSSEDVVDNNLKNVSAAIKQGMITIK